MKYINKNTKECTRFITHSTESPKFSKISRKVMESLPLSHLSVQFMDWILILLTSFPDRINDLQRTVSDVCPSRTTIVGSVSYRSLLAALLEIKHGTLRIDGNNS